LATISWAWKWKTLFFFPDGFADPYTVPAEFTLLLRLPTFKHRVFSFFFAALRLDVMTGNGALFSFAREFLLRMVKYKKLSPYVNEKAFFFSLWKGGLLLRGPSWLMVLPFFSGPSSPVLRPALKYRFGGILFRMWFD